MSSIAFSWFPHFSKSCSWSTRSHICPKGSLPAIGEQKGDQNTDQVTVFPQIVSSLEQFPPLNSFRNLVRKLIKFPLHKNILIGMLLQEKIQPIDLPGMANKDDGGRQKATRLCSSFCQFFHVIQPASLETTCLVYTAFR